MDLVAEDLPKEHDGEIRLSIPCCAHEAPHWEEIRLVRPHDYFANRLPLSFLPRKTLTPAQWQSSEGGQLVEKRLFNIPTNRVRARTGSGQDVSLFIGLFLLMVSVFCERCHQSFHFELLWENHFLENLTMSTMRGKSMHFGIFFKS
jgi:hypothetical protein